jgi:3-oxoacyl-[acyl-carrier protein] reductase
LLYAATKGAVEQMSRVLAKDFGRKGITVNTISPGPIGTGAFYEGKTEEMVTMLGNLSPVGRIGTPEEIARVVAWVSGDESSWVNGQNLRVNGGMTVG